MALQQGKKKPEDWAAFVAQILALQGQKIVKEGKPVGADADLTQAPTFDCPTLGGC